jgi:hypothetical protein
MTKGLLGIDVPDATNLDTVADVLASTLASNHVGLLVFISPNADTYFDMSALQEITQSNASAGVRADIIQQLNLLKIGGPSNQARTMMRALGIDDDTERAFVVWTNNLTDFKLRKQPVEAGLLRRILRRTPSVTIASYNTLLQQLTVKDKTEDDVYAFKRVQYMTFNSSVTEESFLDVLKGRLTKLLVDRCRSTSSSVLASDPEFVDAILGVLDSAKVDMGIHLSMMSAHCHIIYAAMANKVVARLRRVFMERDATLSEEDLKPLVADVVDGNDNIYSRTIASYYLHIA